MDTKIPKGITINARKSTITNAFYNGILPRVTPSEEDLNERLHDLGMDLQNEKCVYCGKEPQTYDHLNPLIVGKKPTGYYTEINNLVPCCNTCNSSKGNKTWREFLEYLKKNNSNKKKIWITDEQYNRSINILENFIVKYPPKKIDFNNPKIKDLFDKYRNVLNNLHTQMDKASVLEEKIKILLQRSLNK